MVVFLSKLENEQLVQEGVNWTPTQEFWEQRWIYLEEYRQQLLERWEFDLEGNLDRLTEVTTSFMGVYSNVQLILEEYGHCFE